VNGIIQLLLAEDHVAVLNGTRVELALPDDLSLTRARLLVVALDQDVTPQWDARRDGDAHFLHVVCDIAATQIKT
jgi:hypothetical protein